MPNNPQRFWRRLVVCWRGSFWFRVGGMRRLALVSTLLLYGLAGVAFVAGIMGSNEWRYRTVPYSFLITVIMLPFLSVAISFLLQTLAFIAEDRDQWERIRGISTFLNALDRCSSGSLTQRVFLGHLLDQWNADTQRLSSGIVTVQEKYWDVCARIFELATDAVECTSAVPLSYWDEDSPDANRELLRYKDAQKEKLLQQGVAVRRTFIFGSLAASGEVEHFLRIGLAQLQEGFCVYYVDLSSVSDPHDQTLASSDFALIDDKILMLGRMSGLNQSVYYYDFYDLQVIPGFFHTVPEQLYPDVFRTPRYLFERDQMGGNKGRQLTIGKYRRKITEFPSLDTAPYKHLKLGIETAAASVKGWR